MSRSLTSMATERPTAVLVPAVALGARHWDITNRAVVIGILERPEPSRSESTFRRVAAMVEDGADAIHLEAASGTVADREPGEEEEIHLVAGTVQDLRSRFDLPLVVETAHASVATAAFRVGAGAVADRSQNDDLACVEAAASAGASVILCQNVPPSSDTGAEVVDVVATWLAARAERAVASGVSAERVVLDPGLDRGGKSWRQSLELLRSCHALAGLGYPLLVCASNKAFLGRLLGLDVEERGRATVAAHALAVAAGARLLRAHDVLRARRVADVTAALLGQ